MNGKSKCKILKEIRQQIARDNDIALVTSECKYQGDCTGTCPKCEAELRYLENKLAQRQQAGKAVVVAGLAATFLLNTTGCVPGDTLQGAPLPPDIQGGLTEYSDTSPSDPADIPGEVTEPQWDGEIDWTGPTEIMGGLEPWTEPVETDPTEKEWMGAPPVPEE